MISIVFIQCQYWEYGRTLSYQDSISKGEFCLFLTTQWHFRNGLSWFYWSNFLVLSLLGIKGRISWLLSATLTFTWKRIDKRTWAHTNNNKSTRSVKKCFVSSRDWLWLLFMKLLIISLKLDKEYTKDIKRGHVFLLPYASVIISLGLVLRTLKKSRKCLNKSPRPKQSLLSIGYLFRGET